MRHFEITPLDEAFGQKMLEYIDDIAKPKGSLWKLEQIARPVSYTHLDVYKRQAHHGSSSPAPPVLHSSPPIAPIPPLYRAHA